jgi:hypothetical protein
MVRLLVRLSLVALAATACWRVGTEYLAHYRFREAVRSATAVQRTADALRQAVLDEASRYGVPLAAGDFSVAFSDRHVVVRGEYVKTIEILPGFERPWSFPWAVETFSSPALDPALPGG